MSTSLGNFAVEIIGGDHDQGGYVYLPHNTRYQLRLVNNGNQRCDAEVKIDGKDIGTFRVAARSNVTIERPTNAKQHFTFYRKDSKKGQKAQLGTVGRDDLGLVSVTFKPEEVIFENGPLSIFENIGRDIPIKSSDFNFGRLSSNRYPQNLKGGQHTNSVKSSRGGPCGQSIACNYSVPASNVSAGGTGLSGKSQQKFTEVYKLNYNEDSFVTINLRLACLSKSNDKRINVLRSVRSTPVPKPV